MTTWADGFGIWHAAVYEQGRGGSRKATALALAAIRDELALREGPRFAPEVVGVKLESRLPQADGGTRTEFLETNANEETQQMVLKRCDNQLCRRKVSQSSRYCCAPCAEAHGGSYEIHERGTLAHTVICDERRDQRGEWPQ